MRNGNFRTSAVKGHTPWLHSLLLTEVLISIVEALEIAFTTSVVWLGASSEAIRIMVLHVMVKSLVHAACIDRFADLVQLV